MASALLTKSTAACQAPPVYFFLKFSLLWKPKEALSVLNMIADLRDPAAARGGLAPGHSLGRVCAPGPASDVGEDACILAALDATR